VRENHACRSGALAESTKKGGPTVTSRVFKSHHSGLAPSGTLFQRRVWDLIAGIPAGQSRTYGELAQKLVTAPRAVGQACGANPIALMIPCHRVVGGLGTLGGFMGRAGNGRDDATSDLFAWERGADPGHVYPSAIKRWLLTHEGYRFGR